MKGCLLSIFKLNCLANLYNFGFTKLHDSFSLVHWLAFFTISLVHALLFFLVMELNYKRCALTVDFAIHGAIDDTQNICIHVSTFRSIFSVCQIYVSLCV